jgi:transcriptional regulator with XRE-family HTH domain
MSMETIGQRIRKRRDELGLTQAELADRCGWSTADNSRQNRISMYENSKRATRIKLEDIEKLATALEVSPIWILFNGAYSALSAARQKLHQTIGRIPEELVGKADLFLQVFVEEETDPDGHRAGNTTSNRAKLT